MTAFFPPIDPKKSFSEIEKGILAFWKQNQIFEKTVSSRPKEKEFVFFDGPPFATGLPHYGHILAGTLKDAIPRYWTMKGYRVERRFGWDCHGVPVEFQVEKENNIGGKPGIEKMGVGNFNELCRSIVLRCADEWEASVERMGRFVDFKNSYRTMDTDYIESVWWVFSELWKKGLIYQGEKVIAYSPKLASPLSNFEEGLNYKDIDDPAVTVKFELENEPGTYFLAWTTTPWTLPSNVAVGFGRDMEYALVEREDGRYWVARDAVERNFGADANIIETKKGKDFLNVRYKPLFPYYVDQNKKRFLALYDNGDYVSSDAGTGIVHFAPSFGEEDEVLCQRFEVYGVNPIDENGYFDETIPELHGKYFRSDPEVAGSKENNANDWTIEQLKVKGLLFAREQIRHSYPHCWRTECALMYRGINTWFVNVQKIKAQLIEQNKKINWIPAHLKDGRFGKMLESAPDWAISRNRYWGAPIPVWQCEKCGITEVISSRKELEDRISDSSGLRYREVPDLHKHFVDDLSWECAKCKQVKTSITVVRHGETDWNKEGKIQGSLDIPLNEEGRAQARKVREEIGSDFDVVIASDRARAIETAQILCPEATIITDERWREKNYGDFEGKTLEEILKSFPEYTTANDIRFEKVPNGESFTEFYPKVFESLEEVLKKYAGKKILIVTHSITVKAAHKFFTGDDLRESKIDNTFSFTAEYTPKFRRIPEVLDCWFESGAMPYASQHYPFESKENQDSSQNIFQPADFIAEGLDQTRGWFYTLHVLGVALFGENIYKNVVTNGIVLAEDGQKMSKSKKNYPDPNLIFEKYGADAMRFYLLSSPAVRAESLRFSEKGVEEVLKSVFIPLQNAYSFFSTYANIDGWEPKDQKVPEAKTELDKWMLSELQKAIRTFQTFFDQYEIDTALRVIPELVDALTNWYIRRSRDRFWASGMNAEKISGYETLYFVLTEISKMLAPICPFYSDFLYKSLVPNAESVHLEYLSEVNASLIDETLSEKTRLVREIVRLSATIRSRKKIKLRQPLRELQFALTKGKEKILGEEDFALIREEANVKTVSGIESLEGVVKRILQVDARKVGPRLGKKVQDIIRAGKEGSFTMLENERVEILGEILKANEYESGFLCAEGKEGEGTRDAVVVLDTEISEALEEEGIARDLIRNIQDLRKQKGFAISDRIEILFSTPSQKIQTVVQHFYEMIAGETLAETLSFSQNLSEPFETLELFGEELLLSLSQKSV